MLKFPQTGVYLLEIYCKEVDQEGSYNSLFKVEYDYKSKSSSYKASKDLGFPRYYSIFSSKLCYLYSPLVKSFSESRGK